MISLVVDPRDPELLRPLAVDGSRVRSVTATVRPSRDGVRLASGGFLTSVLPARESATAADVPITFDVPATDGTEIHADDRSTFEYVVDVEVGGNQGRGRGNARTVTFRGLLPTALGATVQVTSLVTSPVDLVVPPGVTVERATVGLDLDSIDISKVVYATTTDSVVNMPPGEAAVMVVTYRRSTTARVQVAFSAGTSQTVWIRFRGSTGWTAWKRVDAASAVAEAKAYTDSAVAAIPTPASPAGFKRVPLALTVGGGNASYGSLSRGVRMPLDFAPSVTRWRVHIRNINPRYPAVQAGAVDLTGLWVGPHSGVGSFSLVPTQISGPFSTPADGSEWVSPWVQTPIGGGSSFLLAYGFTATAATRSVPGGGWTVVDPADAINNAATRTAASHLPLDVWIEAEVASTVPVIAALGDSLSSGVGATLPVRDSVVSQFARANNALPVHYANSGDDLTSWAADFTHYKWTRWNGLARPDALVIAGGSNDVFALGLTSTQVRDAWTAVANRAATVLTPNIYATTLLPRDGVTGTAETSRKAFNTWLKAVPSPARDVFDIVPGVSPDDEALDPSLTSDGIHLTTAGYAANLAAIVRSLAPQSDSGGGAYSALNVPAVTSYAANRDTSLDLNVTADSAFSVTGTKLGTIVGLRVNPNGHTLTLPGDVDITGTDRVTATAWRMAEGWIYSVGGAGSVQPPDPGDTVAPVAGTLTSSSVTDTGFTLTVSGASDESALHAQPYSFSTDNGATWSAWQSSPTFTVTGKTASTPYTCRHQVRDNATTPHTTLGTAITVTTAAAPETFALDYINAYGDESDQTTYTWGAQTFQFGAAAASRRIVVVIAGRKAAPSATVTAVTIGGVAATKDGEVQDNGTTTSIWSAAVPTGASGSISATFDATMLRANIHTYRLVGSSGKVDDTGATGSALATLDSVSVAGGGIVAGSSSTTGTATTTWTGLTQDAYIGSTMRSAAAHGPTDDALAEASVIWTSNGQAHLAVTYGPAT